MEAVPHNLGMAFHGLDVPVHRSLHHWAGSGMDDRFRHPHGVRVLHAPCPGRAHRRDVLRRLHAHSISRRLSRRPLWPQVDGVPLHPPCRRRHLPDGDGPLLPHLRGGKGAHRTGRGSLLLQRPGPHRLHHPGGEERDGHGGHILRTGGRSHHRHTSHPPHPRMGIGMDGPGGMDASFLPILRPYPAGGARRLASCPPGNGGEAEGWGRPPSAW